MSENWVSLPTASGLWWQRSHNEPDTDVIVDVTVYEGIPHDVNHGHEEIPEMDGITYAKAVPPPPDGERLPRRIEVPVPDSLEHFRFNGCYGVSSRVDGSVVVFSDTGAMYSHGPEWLAEHAGEIEWID